jgi:hypothetical protein
MAVVRQANLFRNVVLLEDIATDSKEIGLEAKDDKIKYFVIGIFQ